MADLIQEFFERELSGPEADSLGTLLQESPDEALRFEGLLENHYLATGLPLPQLPAALQKLSPAAGSLGAAGWTAFVLAIGVGLGLLAWKFWPVSEVGRPQAVLAPMVPVSPMPTLKLIKKPLLPAIQVQPAHPVEVGPTAEGEELSVVVDTAEKSLVTVRVLDSTGREVRHLFTGFVDPGQRSFRWDGNLSAGEPAPPGNYKIDVQTGASHQTKDISIKLN